MKKNDKDNKNKKIVMCFGTFDLLHEGHKDFLKQAKKQGDKLIVIIARDENVKYIKNNLPVENENKRKQNVESLDFVDNAVLGDLKNRYKVIDDFKPDTICIGYDQNAGKLEKILEEKGYNIKIKNLKPYQENIYKSSFKKMKVLFVGRFQPLHNGHLEVIKQLSEKYGEVIIVIGSTNKKNKRNPYSADMRRQMLENSLKNNKIHNYKIILVPDVDDDNSWVSHVTKYTGKIDIVVTGNDLVEKLFNIAGYEVEFINELYFDLSSTKVRNKIKEKKDICNDVPEEVNKIINTTNNHNNEKL